MPPPRSFVVFRDDPTTPSDSTPALGTLPPPIAFGLITFNPDKENVDPITGLRANTDVSGKKRKTGALATKLHVPPPTKSKKLSEEKHESKKRKISLSVTKGKATEEKSRATGEKKDKRVLGSRRGAGPSRSRKISELPKVEEVAEKEENGKFSKQAVIDAKCYELTVSPLADVSEAYEQTCLEPKKVAVGAEDAVAVTDPPSTSVTSSQVHVSPIKTTPPTSPTRTQREASVVVTPERKRNHSTFTFTSPSPAGKRYAARRGSSVDFVPVTQVTVSDE